MLPEEVEVWERITCDDDNDDYKVNTTELAIYLCELEKRIKKLENMAREVKGETLLRSSPLRDKK